MSGKALVLLALTSWVLWCVPAQAHFGFVGFENSFANEDGSFDVEAGSHPWEVTTAFKLNTTTGLESNLRPDKDLRDVSVELPAGFVGDPTATARCTTQEFTTPVPTSEILYPESSLEKTGASCPASSQVGVAEVNEQFHVGVYNLVPPPGVPAELGFSLFKIPIVLTPSVRTGRDYGITVTSKNTSQALSIFEVTTKLWGVPGDKSHDGLRDECLNFYTGGSLGSCSTDAVPKPFLRMPTSCPSGSLVTGITADSWQEPEDRVHASATSGDSSEGSGRLVGCDRLDFSPTVTVAPSTTSANAPSGLNVAVKVPQNTNATGLAEADLKKFVLRLPAGLAVNPSAADGLGACSEAQIGFEGVDQATGTDMFSPGPAACLDSAKVGSVKVLTPLLEQPLEGALYLAEQNNNPFGSLLAVYLVAEGSGVVIKVAGRVDADGSTGQLTTTFDNNPQQPVSEIQARLFGGPRAALVTPPGCGTYKATSELTPWSSSAGTPTSSEDTFETVSECGGGFAPSFTGGTVSNQAGAFSMLAVAFSRSDADQKFGAVTVHTPPGLLGMLAKVPLCGEPAATQGACSQASAIGHTSVAAGAGPNPFNVPEAGQPQAPVYLTGPYKGAPFGLSIVVPAVAGPFNLGNVVVRAAISIDPHTAAVTVASDALPTILQGIPLQVRRINVTVDRDGFMFNPTNCDPLTLRADVSSTQGASTSLSNHFQVANCATLPFKPKFTVSTQAKTSRARGASLDVKVGYPRGTQANIRSVAVDLPKQLPSRLTTIQKACLERTFAANPASCPAASNIGSAKVLTPLLNVPLTGPAYLVSHGGAAFPDVVVVLQGQGVRLDLTGAINIRGVITSSTFATVPDAPVSSFELKLPEGPHSALTTAFLSAKAKHSLCGSKLTMPTTIRGQNGAQIKQSTKITVTGCPKPKAKKQSKKKK